MTYRQWNSHGVFRNLRSLNPWRQADFTSEISCKRDWQSKPRRRCDNTLISSGIEGWAWRKDKRDDDGNSDVGGGGGGGDGDGGGGVGDGGGGGDDDGDGDVGDDGGDFFSYIEHIEITAYAFYNL